MRKWAAATFAATVGLGLTTCSPVVEPSADQSWQQEFHLSECDLASTGRNKFFVLEPDFHLTLEGNDERW